MAVFLTSNMQNDSAEWRQIVKTVYVQLPKCQLAGTLGQDNVVECIVLKIFFE